MSPSPFHGIFNFGNDAPATPSGTEHLGTVELQAETTNQSKDSSGQASESVVLEPHQTAGGQTQSGHIAVDIYEVDDYYIIRAPIAGIKLADLDIEVEGKAITIRGTRKLTDTIPKDQYYLQECFWGEFSRSITLPCLIDPKKVKATFSKDSILKVLVPKEEKVKIIRINEA